MKVDITHRPSYAKATVQLGPGETIKAESGAMMGMSATVQIETKSGGIMKGLKRSLLGGESFFQNTFTAGPEGGRIELVPTLPGDLFHTTLKGRGLVVQDSSYLASDATIEVDTKWAGFKGLFSGEGFVMLHVKGEGNLILSSYGAIDQITLQAGEEYVVDTGHVVAFSDNMEYQNRRVGGLKSTLLSGEGLVSHFKGPGTLWTQSRSTQGLIAWLSTVMPGGGGSSGGQSPGIIGQMMRG